jgi:hypothetical protein
MNENEQTKAGTDLSAFLLVSRPMQSRGRIEHKPLVLELVAEAAVVTAWKFRSFEKMAVSGNPWSFSRCFWKTWM